MGRVLNQQDAAKFLGIAPETLRAWLQSGRVPAWCGRKEGRKWLLSEDALLRWIESGGTDDAGSSKRKK